MMNPKNLAEVSQEDQKKFLESFSYVLSDMDGVIWLWWTPIPGAAECIRFFKKIRKTVVFVSNNNLVSAETTRSHLKEQTFPSENLVTPGSAILDYLKGMDFKKTIYAIGSSVYKDELRQAGFKVLENPPQVINGISEFLQRSQDDPDVGAVIFEADMNLTRIKIQKAVTFLKRPDCLFLAGACDKVFSHDLVGNSHFYKIITDFTGREAVHLAKPSLDFAKFAMNKYGIENANEVLFIGDSIDTDMAFAANVGFKKLLVLSGNASYENVTNWNHPDELAPEYYVKSLNDLKNIIKSVYTL